MTLTDTWQADSAGKSRPHRLVGKTYFHPKTQRLYSVIGVLLDTEREVWMVSYVPVGSDSRGFYFVHTMSDFLREGRFVEVKED